MCMATLQMMAKVRRIGRLSILSSKNCWNAASRCGVCCVYACLCVCVCVFVCGLTLQGIVHYSPWKYHILNADSEAIFILTRSLQRREVQRYIFTHTHMYMWTHIHMYMFTFDRHTCIIDACVCIQIRACMDAIGTGDRPTDRNRDRVSAGERERERKRKEGQIHWECRSTRGWKMCVRENERERARDTQRVQIKQRMKNVGICAIRLHANTHILTSLYFKQIHVCMSHIYLYVYTYPHIQGKAKDPGKAWAAQTKIER